MKKIIYTIEHNKVFENLIDTKLDTIVNFRGIYTGKTKKECEIWLKGFKRGKNGKTKRNIRNNNINSITSRVNKRINVVWKKK